VDQLITAYETGACTRRQLLSGLAAIGIGGTSLSAEQQTRPGSSIARINHINLRVSDLQRSVEFYENLFGPGFRQFPTMLPFDLGGRSMVPYMSVQTDKDVAREGRAQYSPRWHGSLTTKPGTWEHVAFEVDDLDLDKTMAKLKAEGVEATNSGGFIWTHDPDGALLQIVDAKSRGATVGQTLEPITPLDLEQHD
jgi:catechol 2,3-dioxygenase-like lactoylglutathione lyase family enzyme